MSKKKPIRGEKVQFCHKDDEGNWQPMEAVPLNIELPDTKEVDEKYKSFLDSFTERKCIQATMRQPTAQDNLILDVMLNGKKLEN